MRQFRLAVGLFNASLFVAFSFIVFTDGAMLEARPHPVDGSAPALFLILWSIVNAIALLVDSRP